MLSAVLVDERVPLLSWNLDVKEDWIGPKLVKKNGECWEVDLSRDKDGKGEQKRAEGQGHKV